MEKPKNSCRGMCAFLKFPFYLIIAPTMIAFLSQTWIGILIECEWKWIFINSIDAVFGLIGMQTEKKERRIFRWHSWKFVFVLRLNDQTT